MWLMRLTFGLLPFDVPLVSLEATEQSFLDNLWIGQCCALFHNVAKLTTLYSATLLHPAFVVTDPCRGGTGRWCSLELLDNFFSGYPSSAAQYLVGHRFHHGCCRLMGLKLQRSNFLCQILTRFVRAELSLNWDDPTIAAQQRTFDWWR